LSLGQPQSVELRWEIDDQGMQTLRFGVPDQQLPIFCEMICLSGIMMIYNRKSLYDEHEKAL